LGPFKNIDKDKKNKMAEVESIQNLVAARQLLECSLEKSRAYASELDEIAILGSRTKIHLCAKECMQRPY